MPQSRHSAQTPGRLSEKGTRWYGHLRTVLPFLKETVQAAQSSIPAGYLEDVAGLVNEVLLSPEGNRFNSTLMRYYALIDLLKMTVDQVSRATPGMDAKDIATRLSEQHDIFAAAGRKESFRQTAVELLRQAGFELVSCAHRLLEQSPEVATWYVAGRKPERA